MATILCEIWEDNTVSPATYYVVTVPRAELEMEDICRLIHQAEPTVSESACREVLVAMQNIFVREIANGNWILFDGFWQWNPEITRTLSTPTEDVGPNTMEIVCYMQSDVENQIRTDAAFEIIRYAFPVIPYITSCYDTASGLIDHLTELHGFILTGQEFAISRADSETGIWLKSAAGTERKQDRVDLIGSTQLVATAYPVVAEGPAGQNSVEQEVIVRSRYEPGGDVASGSYHPVRAINVIEAGSVALFITGSQSGGVASVTAQTVTNGTTVVLTARYDSVAAELTIAAEGEDAVVITGNGVIQIPVGNSESVSIDIINYTLLLTNIQSYNNVMVERLDLNIAPVMHDLTSGVALPLSTNLAGYLYFNYTIKTSPDMLSIELYGMDGDCDLYAKYGSFPTSSDYDYASERSVNDQIVVQSPADGAIKISVYCASGTTVTIVANDTAIELSSGVGVSGSVKNKNYTYYKITVPSGAANLSITLSGLLADCDMYAKYTLCPIGADYDYGSENGGLNNEVINVASPPAGVVFVGIQGYGGDSTFNIIATVS